MIRCCQSPRPAPLGPLSTDRLGYENRPSLTRERAFVGGRLTDFLAGIGITRRPDVVRFKINGRQFGGCCRACRFDRRRAVGGVHGPLLDDIDPLLDTILHLASERGLDVDLHVDESSDPAANALAKKHGGHKMWTETTREQYRRDGLRYASDMTDAEWAMVEPFMPAVKRLGRPRKVDLRGVVEGLLYILRTACPWRLFMIFQTARRCSAPSMRGKPMGCGNGSISSCSPQARERAGPRSQPLGRGDRQPVGQNDRERRAARVRRWQEGQRAKRRVRWTPKMRQLAKVEPCP